eukprot:1148880-Pelagomonas_calceolata.AAC.1
MDFSRMLLAQLVHLTECHALHASSQALTAVFKPYYAESKYFAAPCAARLLAQLMHLTEYPALHAIDRSKHSDTVQLVMPEGVKTNAPIRQEAWHTFCFSFRSHFGSNNMRLMSNGESSSDSSSHNMRKTASPFTALSFNTTTLLPTCGGGGRTFCFSFRSHSSSNKGPLRRASSSMRGPRFMLSSSARTALCLASRVGSTLALAMAWDSNSSRLAITCCAGGQERNVNFSAAGECMTKMNRKNPEGAI